MVPDVLDYQQWKTGKRLEGFWQNSSAFIMTVCGFFTSALMPLFMSLGGVGFGDNIDEALKNPVIMESTFRSVTWLGIIASVICIIPLFFYDLTEKKHANYIRALQLRAAARNKADGTFSEEDEKSVSEIRAYAEENSDEFLLQEISRVNL